MKKFLLLAAAFLALQAVPALAQDAPSSTPPKPGSQHEGRMFDMQDANKDGVVSEEEFLAFGKAKFAEMDKDKDGKLTKEEAKSHRDSMRDKWKEKRKDMKGEKPADAPAPEAAPPAAE